MGDFWRRFFSFFGQFLQLSWGVLLIHCFLVAEFPSLALDCLALDCLALYCLALDCLDVGCLALNLLALDCLALDCLGCSLINPLIVR